MCPIPWNFTAVRNNGDVRVCCQANISKSRGILRKANGEAFNAKDGDLKQSRNAEIVRKMRLNMIAGKWPSECVRCQQEEEAGLNSRRHYEIENWKPDFDYFESVTQSDGSIDPSKAPVQYFDLRFGNKCNLACRMCGPTDSDFWYSDHVELTGQTEFKDSHGKVSLQKSGNRYVDPSNSYSWHESPKFWEALEENMTGVKHIYMAGGEPMLIEQHYDFVEQCVDKGYSKDIILEYNTNMTILPQRIINLWQNFKEVRVGASIDGFGEVLEIQRYPAKWPVIYRNLQKLDSLPAPVFSWLACTVTVYNVFHLPDFMKWKVLESGFERINSTRKRPIISHHVAHNPHHLNIRVLSDAEKQLVQQKFNDSLKDFESQFTDHQFEKAKSILDSVETYMVAKSYHSVYNEQFQKYTAKLDEIRGQQSHRLLPVVP
jgi:hypothetical protein